VASRLPALLRDWSAPANRSMKKTVELLLDPPDGRLSHAAYRILAAELCVDEEEIHCAVFPGVPYHRR